jgi:hypothetical protein
MAWGKDAETLPAELDVELAKVRKAAPPPSDDPIYKYLRCVYRLRCKVASSPEWKKAIKTYHQAHCPKTLQQYVGVIIEMTNDHVTTTMKHKYATALEYAFKAGIKSKDLKAFIKKQGGLNKCVETARPALTKQAKKKSAI